MHISTRGLSTRKFGKWRRNLIAGILTIFAPALIGCGLTPAVLANDGTDKAQVGPKPVVSIPSVYAPVSSLPEAPVVSPPILIESSTSALLPGESALFKAKQGMNPVVVSWTITDESGNPLSKTNTSTPSSEIRVVAPESAGRIKIQANLPTDALERASTWVDVIWSLPINGEIHFGFDLPYGARTSAGVFDKTGNLVRTLWSNRSTNSGPQMATWDGRDNNGSPLPSNAEYKMRVAYSNVHYVWDVIGDTSTSFSGPATWDLQASFPTDMTVVQGSAYVANGYAELRNNASAFELTNPQAPSGLFNIDQQMVLQYVTADDDHAYFANVGSGWLGSRTFVMAYDLKQKEIFAFSQGTQVTVSQKKLKGVIDLDPQPNPPTGASRIYLPTGIAVQRKGNLLAIAHGDFVRDKETTVNKGSDAIVIYDKKSGAFLRTINIPNPQRMVIDKNDSLWVISNSNLISIPLSGNDQGIAIKNMDHPLALTVDQVSGDILVAVGGKQQQVLRYGPSGELKGSYGKRGGYNDCDPTVTNDRFFLDATAGSGTGNIRTPFTWLASSPDGTFWIGEPANSRAIHLSGSGDYLGQFAFIPYLYYIAADHGDPTRLFADLLEFHVAYDAGEISNQSNTAGNSAKWSLRKNWSVCLASSYLPGIKRVFTFPDKRTYAEIPNTAYPNNASLKPLELVELPASGPVRPTGQVMQTAQGIKLLDDEGNFAYWYRSHRPGNSKVGTMIAFVEPFVSGGSQLKWGSPIQLANIDQDTELQGKPGPYGFAGWGMTPFPKVTSRGYVPTFRPDPTNILGAPHLGGIRVGEQTWAWGASPEALIDLPDGQGSFPQKLSAGGHNGISIRVEGKNIIEGYDGQYGSFSSQWMHYLDDGLLVGQFGTPSHSVNSDGTIPDGAAGNIAMMTTVVAGGEIFLYTSDEGVHPGIHQWHLADMNTLHEVEGTGSLGSVTVLSREIF